MRSHRCVATLRPRPEHPLLASNRIAPPAERERYVGGFPGEVVGLNGTPWIAVGQYLGGAVLVLDADSLAEVARLPAAWKVRGVAWDVDSGGSTSRTRRG